MNYHRTNKNKRRNHKTHKKITKKRNDKTHKKRTKRRNNKTHKKRNYRGGVNIKNEQAIINKKKEDDAEIEKQHNIKMKKYLNPDKDKYHEAHPYGQRITKYRDDYGEGITFGGKRKFNFFF